MAAEPPENRTVVFFDGQNLFHAVRKAFGYTYPNFDALALARSVCLRQNWRLDETRFYTGVPDVTDDPFWHRFWTNKLAHVGRTGVVVYSRPLRYRNNVVKLPDGTEHSYLTGEEKGIDVRIAVASQNRWLKIASAFPVSPVASNRKGINWTDWIGLDREAYDACIDPRDYRPRPTTPTVNP